MYKKDGWKNLKLEDVCSINYGKDYRNLSKGGVPVYGTGGIMTYIDKYLYNKTSVLLPRKGSLDNVYYVEGKFWTIDTLFWTEINEEIIIPKYLFYLLSKMNLYKLNQASAIPSLSVSILNKINIKIPDIDTQKRIVNILSTWDEVIKLKEDKTKNLEKLLLQTTLDLTKGKIKLKNDNSEWNVSKLSSIFEDRKEYGFQKDGLELYSLTIEDGITEKTDRYNREFLVRGNNKKYKIAKYNDIVFNSQNLRYGAIDLNSVKKNVLVSPIYTTLELKNNDFYDIEYLNFLLNNNEMFRFYDSISEGTLVERMAVKPEHFLSLEFSFPSKNVQQDISKILNSIKQLIIRINEEIILLKEQQKGLMQRLLTGNLILN